MPETTKRINWMNWTRNRGVLLILGAIMLLHSFFVPRGRDPGSSGDMALATALVWRTASRTEPSNLTVLLGVSLAMIAWMSDSLLLSCKGVLCVLTFILLSAAFLFWDSIVQLLA